MFWINQSYIHKCLKHYRISNYYNAKEKKNNTKRDNKYRRHQRRVQGRISDRKEDLFPEQSLELIVSYHNQEDHKAKSLKSASHLSTALTLGVVKVELHRILNLPVGS